MSKQAGRFAAGTAAGLLVATAASVGLVANAAADPGDNGKGQGNDPATVFRTATPIKHLVVIFQENVSFDHYFGTYPYATNADGSPFTAAPGTPQVNGLGNPGDPGSALLFHNPNEADPQRLSRSQALTCDQGHGYTQEQRAFDQGLMDKYVQNTDNESCSPPAASPSGLVMDYYDGNTVTAMWNYAQHFSMNDNSFNTVFGPSTPGALNLVSGQTHGTTSTSGAVANGTVFGDADPTFDDCSSTAKPTIAMSGRNIGDMLSTARITWGWFEGGFRPTSAATPTTRAVCGSAHPNIGGGKPVTDYIPHHEPFQYYRSTANVHHLPPATPDEIGHDGQANHQYDMNDFFTALSNHDLPAVSYLKAPAYQDGHAGYSDPLDEQTFVVNVVNLLEQSPEWKSTAVVINYDDSDGWYDHAMPPIVNSSRATEDALNGAGACGNGTPLGGYEDRCGYGPRLPMMVISPFARVNFVDGTLTDQTSILRLVEDNWLGGQRVEPLSTPSPDDGLQGSFDNLAGPLDNMFDFGGPPARKLLLDPATGELS